MVVEIGQTEGGLMAMSREKFELIYESIIKRFDEALRRLKEV